MKAETKWAIGLGVTSLVVYIVTWGLIWQGRVNTNSAKDIFEPALVAIQLGFVSAAAFFALYLREDTDRVRAAIVGAVVLPFMLLVVDLTTLPDFRESLAGAGGGEIDPNQRLDFVQQMFDTFKWVIVTIIGFYFAAEATEKVTDKAQTEKTTRTEHEVRIAQAQAFAAGSPVPEAAVLPAPTTPS